MKWISRTLALLMSLGFCASAGPQQPNTTPKPSLPFAMPDLTVGSEKLSPNETELVRDTMRLVPVEDNRLPDRVWESLRPQTDSWGRYTRREFRLYSPFFGCQWVKVDEFDRLLFWDNRKGVCRYLPFGEVLKLEPVPVEVRTSVSLPGSSATLPVPRGRAVFEATGNGKLVPIYDDPALPTLLKLFAKGREAGFDPADLQTNFRVRYLPDSDDDRRWYDFGAAKCPAIDFARSSSPVAVILEGKPVEFVVSLAPPVGLERLPSKSLKLFAVRNGIDRPIDIAPGGFARIGVDGKAVALYPGPLGLSQNDAIRVSWGTDHLEPVVVPLNRHLSERVAPKLLGWPLESIPEAFRAETRLRVWKTGEDRPLTLAMPRAGDAVLFPRGTSWADWTGGRVEVVKPGFRPVVLEKRQWAILDGSAWKAEGAKPTLVVINDQAQAPFQTREAVHAVQARFARRLAEMPLAEGAERRGFVVVAKGRGNWPGPSADAVLTLKKDGPPTESGRHFDKPDELFGRLFDWYRHPDGGAKSDRSLLVVISPWRQEDYEETAVCRKWKADIEDPNLGGRRRVIHVVVGVPSEFRDERIRAVSPFPVVAIRIDDEKAVEKALVDLEARTKEFLAPKPQ